MTLTTLLIRIFIASIAITGITAGVFNQRKNILVSFLQNFCGALFIFSGWVKAIDPLGTAYKMEQYFAEFESTFQETWMSFIAPIFPVLSDLSVSFSVVMIIFEIVLGLMLIIGASRKFTSWAFLLLVGFFTFLTGFTYLTGYVPEGVNFFSVGQWGNYLESNMKVTDCGCFGDFIKLKPYTSFLKDVALLVPAFLFVFMSKDMHQLFTPKTRTATIVGSTALLALYCFSNYVWDLPHADFRPFKEGVNVRAQKAAEEDAMVNAPLTYVLTNKETKEVTRLPYADYMKQFANFPKDKFDTESESGEPAIPQTKISEFMVEDVNGYEKHEDILNEPGYSLMYVCNKLKFETAKKMVMVNDTVSWLTDTIHIQGTNEIQYVRKPEKIVKKEVEVKDYLFDEGYLKRFTEVANPFAEAAQKSGVKVFGVAGGVGAEGIAELQKNASIKYPFYTADDILLKTIVRSNPGIVLLKDGQIIKKWHIKKLPSFEEVKKEFIK